MPYPLPRMRLDIAQVQHEAAGFGTGQLVTGNLVLTAAHVLWRCEADRVASVAPALDGWQVRLVRDHDLSSLARLVTQMAFGRAKPRKAT